VHDRPSRRRTSSGADVVVVSTAVVDATTPKWPRALERAHSGGAAREMLGELMRFR
jgi:hypothetical protein